MDLSEYDLPEEVKAKIMAQHTLETEGLRTSKDAILAEKKTLQVSSVEQSQLLEESRLANNKLAEQKLIDEGKYTEALALRETEFNDMSAKEKLATKTATDALLSRDKGVEMTKVMSLIHDDYKGIAKAELSNILKIGYNEQGMVTTTYEHEGKVVANNIDEFSGWAAEQPQFKRILNGVDSSGANTTQSRGSASITDNNNPEAVRKAGITSRLNASGIQTK